MLFCEHKNLFASYSVDVHMEESKHSLHKLVVSFHRLGPEDLTQVVCGRCPYSLHCLLATVSSLTAAGGVAHRQNSYPVCVNPLVEFLELQKIRKV